MHTNIHIKIHKYSGMFFVRCCSSDLSTCYILCSQEAGSPINALRQTGALPSCTAFNLLTAKHILRCLFYFTIIQEVVSFGHNKLCTTSGCSRSLAGPLGQPDSLCWPFGPVRYLLLSLRASKSSKTLKWKRSWSWYKIKGRS